MLAKKQNLKRVFSSFLALIMLLGLLPTSAFAAGSGKPAEVVDQGEVVTSKDGLVTVHKTAKHTDGNNLDITLEVTTKDQVQVTPAQPTHVVLVIDRSNSMAGQRIKSTRQAAKEFAQIVLGEDAAEDNQIAVVSYTRSWESRIGLSGDLGAVETAIDQINTWGNETYGGTNIQSGIYAAEQILAQDSSDADKVIVLFSDGYPTYCYELTGTAKGACTGGIMWPGDVDASTIQITGRDTKSIIGPGNDSEIQGDWWDWFNLFTGDNLSLTVTCTIDEAVHNFFHGKNHVEYQDVKYDYETGSISKRADTSWNTIWEADQAKSNAQLYTVLLSPASHSEAEQAKTLMAKLASEGKYYETSNTNELAEIFKGIAGSITTPTNAGMVTDPMGQFITLGDVSGLADQGVTKTQDGLTWNVAASTPKENSDGSKTYTVTYPITLDTSAEGFVDDLAYAANGTTTFNYTVNGDSRSVNFDVPTLKGYAPMVSYTIEYYKMDRETGKYPDQPTATEQGGTVRLWTTVNAPDGYKTKYEKENYTFASGDEQMTLSRDGMVMKLYYTLTPATVMVNHHVSTITKKDDGEVYSVPTVQKTTPYSDGIYAGDKFTVPEADLLDSAVYTKVDSLKVGDQTYTTDDYTDVKLSAGQNVIDIYYTTTGDDQRTPLEYKVNYWYRDASWKLVDGKYELVYEEYSSGLTLSGTEHHGDTVTIQDLANGYTLDKIEGSNADNQWQLTLNKDNQQPAVVNVYYSKAPTTPPAETATLTIVHNFYEKDVYGSWLMDTQYELVDETVYVGETYTAEDRSGNGYARVTSDENCSMTIPASGSYELVIEYVKDVRQPVDIVINHYYTTYTWTVDQETGEGSYQEGETIKNLGVKPEGTHYVGEIYTPQQIPNGYTYVSGGEAQELTEGTNTFDLYYAAYEGSEADEADVTVNHIYVTYTSYVDNEGNVVLNEASSETESEDTHYGMKDDTFYAEKKEKDGFKFVKADTVDLLVTLQGEDGQYNLYYEKTVNNLGKSYNVAVQPIYKTYTTRLNADGTTTTVLTDTTKSEAVTMAGSFYLGQKVSALAADYGKEGFAYDADDADNTKNLSIFVTGENDVITIVYSKTEIDVPVVVKVNNVYTTETTYIENGAVKTDSQSFTGSSTTYGPYYEGQMFSTEGKGTQLPGYDLDTSKTQPEAQVEVTKDGMEITFYWICKVDHTTPATVQVIHHYTVYDRNPNVETRTWTVGEKDAPIGGHYVGERYVAPTNFQNDEFTAANIVRVTPDGATDPAQGAILGEGNNEIHIYYEKTIDTRAESSIKIVHNYYKDDAALTAGTTEASYTETVEKAMEGDVYTATLRLENQELPYTFHSANPENYTITVDADAAKNVITINYLRTDTYYVVNHTYYLDGELQGTVTDEPVPAKVGDVITAESIEKKTTYKDNSYEYVSADKESITLGADGAYNVITLRYEGSTSIGPSVTRYDLVVKYLEQGTEKELANTYSTTVRRGNDYDATSRTEKEIDGYVIVDVTGDAVKGTMNGDKEIIVWYEADDNEIVDPETPLNPDPGTDPDDGNNNPGDGGETDIGDPETPLNPDPGTGDGTGDGAGDVPGDGGETDIGDGETPMGDLPQTGMTAAPVNPTVTVGLVALAMSMASLGLFFTFGRKKGEEED